jgi:type II secretory ATPase GspE/PulE/Tfp pilus assembly ATPase PilB-like protein
MNLESLYDRAITRGASKLDVHFLSDSAFVQFRIHGELQPPEAISLQDGRSIVDEAAALAEGGQIRHEVAPGKSVFLSTNAYDDARSGNAVVQVMVTVAPPRSLEDLGYTPDQVAEIERIAASPSATTLLAGTTGGSVSKNG